MKARSEKQQPPPLRPLPPPALMGPAPTGDEDFPDSDMFFVPSIVDCDKVPQGDDPCNEQTQTRVVQTCADTMPVQLHLTIVCPGKKIGIFCAKLLIENRDHSICGIVAEKLITQDQNHRPGKHAPCRDERCSFDGLINAYEVSHERHRDTESTAGDHKKPLVVEPPACLDQFPQSVAFFDVIDEFLSGPALSVDFRGSLDRRVIPAAGFLNSLQVPAAPTDARLRIFAARLCPWRPARLALLRGISHGRNPSTIFKRCY